MTPALIPSGPVPASFAELTPDLLTRLVQQKHPQAVVEQVEVLEIKDYDSLETSSSARAYLKLRYADGNPAQLPEQVIAKMSQSDDTLWYSNLRAMYANEVAFYGRLRDELEIEAPRSFGGAMRADGRYILLLEDLRPRGVQFFTVLDDSITVAHVRQVLDTLARLHARYWQSPRFATDLAWVPNQLDSELEQLYRTLLPAAIGQEVKLRKFKRELLGMIGMSDDDLFRAQVAMKAHQATSPQTVLHGDPHLGNLYFLPNGRAGFIDWQLMVKGHVVHDLCYHITTALPVETRRREERALLDFYLERLQQYGVAQPPEREALWLEFRRAGAWGIYPGWLAVPAECYGWELSFVAHLRVVQAFVDHDTKALVQPFL